MRANSALGRPRIGAEELEARKARALELLRAGLGRREVALQSQLSGTWVKQLAQESAIPKPRRNPPAEANAARQRAKQAKVERALELLRAGYTWADVGSACRLSYRTVSKAAQAAGLRPSPRRPGLFAARGIESLSFAELDQLEADVARKRESGELPPILPDA